MLLSFATIAALSSSSFPDSFPDLLILLLATAEILDKPLTGPLTGQGEAARHQSERTNLTPFIDETRDDEDHLKIIESELSDRDQALKVIVLSAFARSGSTFLSRLLAAPPASSYWHEPLRYLYEKPAPYKIFGRKKSG